MCSSRRRQRKGMKTMRVVPTRIGSFTGGVVLSGLLAVVGGCGPSTDGPSVAGGGIDVTSNVEAAFAVGVVPALAPPLRVGTPIGFRLSSSVDGLGHLYLIASTGDVTVLAENLPLAAGSQVDYPDPQQEFTITATPPAGVDRVILLVTLEPFAGFGNSQGGLLSRPVGLTLGAEVFLRRFDETVRGLPGPSWATAETRVQVVG